MKAYALCGIADLRYQEQPEPELQEGWALVRVKAAGICSSDIPRIFVKGTYHFPTIPGHEFSGVVEKVGSEKDAGWCGKRVGVFPLIPCRTCAQCRQHRYEMCEHYDYIGSRRDGAFAELVAVPVWNLLELPDGVPFRTAAMLEPLSVARHAVERLNLSAEDSVAVLGTGMIGFAAAQWARALGAARVCVIGRSEAKRKIAQNLTGIEYLALDQAADNSFSRVVEAVGSADTVNRAIKLAVPGATIVMLGNPEGDILLAQDVYWKLLRKQLTVTGTWNSTYESGEICDWTKTLQALADRTVAVDSLITHCFPQEALPQALQLMKEHKEPYCKILIDWNEKQE